MEQMLRPDCGRKEVGPRLLAEPQDQRCYRPKYLSLGPTRSVNNISQADFLANARGTDSKCLESDGFYECEGRAS